jgi:hypothetical protein
MSLALRAGSQTCTWWKGYDNSFRNMERACRCREPDALPAFVAAPEDARRHLDFVLMAHSELCRSPPVSALPSPNESAHRQGPALLCCQALPSSHPVNTNRSSEPRQFGAFGPPAQDVRECIRGPWVIQPVVGGVVDRGAGQELKPAVYNR